MSFYFLAIWLSLCIIIIIIIIITVSYAILPETHEVP